MKKLIYTLGIMLALAFANPLKAVLYTFTIEVPQGYCDYDICASYLYTQNARVGQRPTIAESKKRCVFISVGNSYVFSFNVSNPASLLGFRFEVNSGAFSHVYTASTGYTMSCGNCENLYSNPVTVWEPLSANHFQIFGDYVL